jgi:hypothetical protein
MGVNRGGVHGGSVADALLQALDTAERSGFENIEHLFLARDQIRQVAAAAINGRHEQADTVRIVSLGRGGVLFEKSPEPVGIACLQELKTMFENTLGDLHGASVQLLSTANEL